jgi:hypothetical protein
LEPLGTTRLHQRLRDIIDSRHWSLCVTLTTGDVLFGDFYGLHVPIDNPHGFALHVPSYLDERSRSLGFAFRLEPFEIIYNDPEGSVHGSARVVGIPNDRVAAIETIWWNVASRTGFKNLPNPYASLVWNHNEAVARKTGFALGGIAEFAMSTSHVTTDGIHFTKQQLLYADYAYFGRLPSTSLSVGLFGAGADVTAGIDSLVLSVLQGDLAGRVRTPGALQRHMGFIEPLPEEVNTEFEGDTWLLFVLSPPFPMTHRLPVLFKRTAVSYPREFWQYIESPLVVMGETMQIPLAYQNEAWTEAITARVIGFVSDET